jgi:hypothetical protein
LGKFSVTSIELVFHSGTPRIVNTCGSNPSDCAYLVSGQVGLGFAERFSLLGPRYCTYTHTQRTKLLYSFSGTWPLE